jgi:hypothetical protein
VSCESGLLINIINIVRNLLVSSTTARNEQECYHLKSHHSYAFVFGRMWCRGTV